MEELSAAMLVPLLDANIVGEVLLVDQHDLNKPSIHLPKNDRRPLCDPAMLATIQQFLFPMLEKKNSTSLPIGILVAPDGRLWKIEAQSQEPEPKSPSPKTALGQPVPPQSIAVLRSKIQTISRIAATSPLREQLSADLLEAHSVLLLVEGSDEAQNLAAKALAKQTIEDIEAGLGNLPKAIAKPPKLVVVSAEEIAQEAVLLWSLGIPTDDTDVSHLVVLFGRMRKMGDVVTVPGATERDLAGPLYFIGQDCECELDRSVMQGIMTPHTWGGKLEADAARQLRFDPGHAMVKVEMSRILAHGPSSGRRELGVGTLGFNHPGLWLGGYTEIAIEPLIENNEEPMEPMEFTEPPEPTGSDRSGLSDRLVVASGQKKPATSSPVSPEPTLSHGIWWIVGGIAVGVLLLSGFVLLRTRGEV